ncbi:MAG: hypothetical protein CL912_21265 [Deltaproteobacteria bacterium]|nr:hypothetical protein [Deltaproteobacteria bacterium]
MYADRHLDCQDLYLVLSASPPVSSLIPLPKDYPSPFSFSASISSVLFFSSLTLHSRSLPRYEIILWFQFGYLWVGLFIIEMIYFFGFCMPFSQYWALPVTNPECATYHNYSIVQMVFNISSNVVLILTPIPMVSEAQLPMKRKLILSFIFGLVLFTIMAAVLDK